MKDKPTSNEGSTFEEIFEAFFAGLMLPRTNSADESLDPGVVVDPKAARRFTGSEDEQ
jgi:hypothetical protein